MFQVPVSAVAHWGTANNFAYPAAIDMACPCCRRAVTFTPQRWDPNTLKGQPLAVRCPRCRESVLLIRLGGGPREEVRLYVDAEPVARDPLTGIEQIPDEVMPPKLKKAYQSALNVLTIGEAEATASQCRRVLEGVTRRVLPPEVTTTNLARRIQALAQQDETLARPLIDLADSLREGGNLGAHFNDEVDTSIDDAVRMVELLDYLLTYLFVLPERIHQFRSEVLEGNGSPASVGDNAN